MPSKNSGLPEADAQLRRRYAWIYCEHYRKVLDKIAGYDYRRIVASVTDFEQNLWRAGLSESELFRSSYCYKEPQGKRVKQAKVRYIRVLKRFRVVFTFLDEQESVVLLHVYCKPDKSNRELNKAIDLAIDIQGGGKR